MEQRARNRPTPMEVKTHQRWHANHGEKDGAVNKWCWDNLYMAKYEIIFCIPDTNHTCKLIPNGFNTEWERQIFKTFQIWCPKPLSGKNFLSYKLQILKVLKSDKFNYVKIKTKN